MNQRMKMSILRASHINVLVFVLFGLAKCAYLIDFSHVLHHNLANVKREGKSRSLLSFQVFEQNCSIQVLFSIFCFTDSETDIPLNIIQPLSPLPLFNLSLSPISLSLSVCQTLFQTLFFSSAHLFMNS